MPHRAGIPPFLSSERHFSFALGAPIRGMPGGRTTVGTFREYELPWRDRLVCVQNANISAPDG